MADVDAVLFDLDETLILDEPMNQHALFVAAFEGTQDEAKARALAKEAHAELLRQWASLPPEAAAYATRIGHSAIEGLWATYDLRLDAEAALDQALQRIRPGIWAHALEQLGLRGDPAAMERRFRGVREKFPLFDDTDRVLAALRPRFKLGIVTNGVAGLQQRKVNGSGLLHWFDAAAISGAVGIGKPERGIFDWVCERLQVRPERCVMVGDNSARDVLGGLNAGMRTVWLDRGYKPRAAQEHVRVESLTAVLQVLGVG